MPRLASIPGARIPERGGADAIQRALQVRYASAPFAAPEEARQALSVNEGTDPPVPEPTDQRQAVGVDEGLSPPTAEPTDQRQAILVDQPTPQPYIENDPTSTILVKITI